MAKPCHSQKTATYTKLFSRSMQIFDRMEKWSHSKVSVPESESMQLDPTLTPTPTHARYHDSGWLRLRLRLRLRNPASDLGKYWARDIKLDTLIVFERGYKKLPLTAGILVLPLVYHNRIKPIETRRIIYNMSWIVFNAVFTDIMVITNVINNLSLMLQK